jgi:hypothetical protein
MRRTGLIITVILAVLIGSIFAVSKIRFHMAKAQAQKEMAEKDGYALAVLNSVPKSPPKRIRSSDGYTNTIWMNVDGYDLGFPAERYTRDTDPKRKDVVLHHAQYRILIFPGSGTNEFESVMQFVNETNFYDFSRNVFNATANDIPRQQNKEALERRLILLKTKMMLAPIGFQDSCIEFDRGDLKGFIIGDPARNKYVYIRIYIEAGQKYIDLSVIQEAKIQFSDLEELISALKTPAGT